MRLQTRSFILFLPAFAAFALFCLTPRVCIASERNLIVTAKFANCLPRTSEMADVVKNIRFIHGLSDLRPAFVTTLMPELLRDLPGGPRNAETIAARITEENVATSLANELMLTNELTPELAQRLQLYKQSPAVIDTLEQEAAVINAIRLTRRMMRELRGVFLSEGDLIAGGLSDPLKPFVFKKNPLRALLEDASTPGRFLEKAHGSIVLRKLSRAQREVVANLESFLTPGMKQFADFMIEKHVTSISRIGGGGVIGKDLELGLAGGTHGPVKFEIDSTPPGSVPSIRIQYPDTDKRLISLPVTTPQEAWLVLWIFDALTIKSSPFMRRSFRGDGMGDYVRQALERIAGSAPRNNVPRLPAIAMDLNSVDVIPDRKERLRNFLAVNDDALHSLQASGLVHRWSLQNDSAGDYIVIEVDPGKFWEAKEAIRSLIKNSLVNIDEYSISIKQGKRPLGIEISKN